MPSPSTDPAPHLDTDARRALLAVARASITHGLRTGVPLAVSPADYPTALQAPGASFVTLRLDGELRGCIGQLEASRALVADVAENAFAAAFRDPRFAPLSAAEWPTVKLHVSVLEAPQPMSVRDEADLLDQLVPGRDGLILRDGLYRATFLPSVWDTLPTPRDFVAQLKRKAGLAPDHWSEGMVVMRYRAEDFGED